MRPVVWLAFQGFIQVRTPPSKSAMILLVMRVYTSCLSLFIIASLFGNRSVRLRMQLRLGQAAMSGVKGGHRRKGGRLVRAGAQRQPGSCPFPAGWALTAWGAAPVLGLAGDGCKETSLKSQRKREPEVFFCWHGLTLLPKAISRRLKA